MGGKHLEEKHFKVLTDCAEICATSSKFMLRESMFHSVICGTCAEICKACAKSCEEIGFDDETMKACADACRQCAESCEKMAASHH